MHFNKIFYFLIFITSIANAEEPNLAAFRSYCETDKLFKSKLIDVVRLDGPKSNKNVAFSNFATTLAIVNQRCGYPVKLGKKLDKKGEDPVYLFFSENNKIYEFTISASEGHEFGDEFFSMLRMALIAQFLGEIINSGGISKNTDLIQFKKIYNELYYKSTVIIKNDIDRIYSEWIESENVTYNKERWQNEIQNIDVVIEANKNKQRSTMIRELHESINKSLELKWNEQNTPKQ
jgi:hypothetical protein